MKSFYKIYILVILLFSDFVLFAQPGDDDGSGGLEGDDTPAAPINGKLIWLGIVGLLFAFYYFSKKRQNA
jgi:LPXTG-motif cell wall-anchored protein